MLANLMITMMKETERPWLKLIRLRIFQLLTDSKQGKCEEQSLEP
jgi:hypothetical protein